MQMVMAEYSGKRAGFFRPKPVRKCGKVCPLCGKVGHVGRTTCRVKRLASAHGVAGPSPQTDAQFTSAIAAASCSHGKDMAAVWRDVACEMRDLCRMLERDRPKPVKPDSTR